MAQKFVTVRVKRALWYHARFFLHFRCFACSLSVFMKRKLNYARIKLGFSALRGMTQFSPSHLELCLQRGIN